MPQITVTPKYVNPPKPGKKYASIHADSVYYGFDPNKIPVTTFQKGVSTTFEYETSEGGYHSITKVLPPAQGGASATFSSAAQSDGWPRERVQGHRRLEIAKACIAANVGSEIGMRWLSWINEADA